MEWMMRFRDWDINLKVRLIGEAFVQISFWMIFPFLTIYFSESFGRGITSILLMISQIIAVICGLFGGYFADQYGRRRMMLIAVSGEAVGYGIFAIASIPSLDSPILGFIGFTVASLFSNFYYPAAQAMIADVVDSKHRSYVFSIFYMMVNIAVVIGPLLGAIFFTHYRFELLLMVTFGAVLLFVLLFKYSHETAPRVVKQVDRTKKQDNWMEVLAQQIKDYRIIFKDRILLLFIIGGILLAQIFMQLDLFIPIHLTDTIDQATLIHWGDFNWTVNGTELFGVVIAINGAMVATLTVLVTKAMNKYSDKLAFVGSALLYGLSILLMGIFPFAWMYIFCIVLFSFAELMTVGIQQNFISELAPDNQRAMYFSAAQMRQSIGRVIAPFSITLSALIGSRLTTIFLALTAITAAFIYIKMYHLYESTRNTNSQHT